MPTLFDEFVTSSGNWADEDDIDLEKFNHALDTSKPVVDHHNDVMDHHDHRQDHFQTRFHNDHYNSRNKSYRGNDYYKPRGSFHEISHVNLPLRPRTNPFGNAKPISVKEVIPVKQTTPADPSVNISADLPVTAKVTLPPKPKSNPFGNAKPVDQSKIELDLKVKLEKLSVNSTTFRLGDTKENVSGPPQSQWLIRSLVNKPAKSDPPGANSTLKDKPKLVILARDNKPELADVQKDKVDLALIGLDSDKTIKIEQTKKEYKRKPSNPKNLKRVDSSTSESLQNSEQLSEDRKYKNSSRARRPRSTRESQSASNDTKTPLDRVPTSPIASKISRKEEDSQMDGKETKPRRRSKPYKGKSDSGSSKDSSTESLKNTDKLEKTSSKKSDTESTISDALKPELVKAISSEMKKVSTSQDSIESKPFTKEPDPTNDTGTETAISSESRRGHYSSNYRGRGRSSRGNGRGRGGFNKSKTHPRKSEEATPVSENS